MGFADLDFLAKEMPVISGAPVLFFGGVIAIIIPSILLIWFLVNWVYRHQLAAKDDQLAARDERLTHARESQQRAEQKSNDLQSDIERLVAQLAAKASSEDIAVTVSSAKINIGELVAANNEVRSAVGEAVGRATAVGVGRAVTKADKEVQNDDST